MPQQTLALLGGSSNTVAVAAEGRSLLVLRWALLVAKKDFENKGMVGVQLEEDRRREKRERMASDQGGPGADPWIQTKHNEVGPPKHAVE